MVTQQDVMIYAASEQLSIEEEEEGISRPIAAQILDFYDHDVEAVGDGDPFPPPGRLSPLVVPRSCDDVFSSSASAVAAVNSTGVSASTSVPCYADDAPFSPFPSLDAATLSALLDAPPAQPPDPEPDLIPAVRHPSAASSSSLNPPPLAMFPVAPPYVGGHDLNPFDHQASMGDATTSEYRPYSPDSAARGPPGHRHPQQAAASEGEYYAAAAAGGMQKPAGFPEMEAALPCALLDGGGVGALYYPAGMGCGEGPHGFFYAGGMMATRPEEGYVGPSDMAEYQRMESGFGLYGHEQAPRPAYSAGDVQVIGGGSQHLMAGSSGSQTPMPASTDVPAMDDSTFKVGRLSVEERKEKIHRYMKKRNERNFSKKIKYACRKTLADSRPRVRGRFAKNDEFGEITKPSSTSHDFDDEEEVVVKEEDILDSDILAHISGVNSFMNNFSLESWI